MRWFTYLTLAWLLSPGLLACGGDANERVDSPEPADGVQVEGWPCEQEGYPCTWEEVSAEATERAFALADQALERFEPGAAAAVADWLERQSDVVEAGEEDPSLVWFRVEGGRRIMVQGPLPTGSLEARLQGLSGRNPRREFELRRAGVGSVLNVGWDLATSWAAERRSEPLRLPGVTGRDRNADARVNQRDERKALILESTYWEDCYEQYAPEDPEEEARQRSSIEARCEREEYVSVGEKIEGVLEGSPVYQGRVTRLRNQEVDFDAIASWADYDVIHVDGHGSRNSMCLGTEIGWPGQGKLRGAAARRRGVDPTVFRAGKEGPKKSVWCVNHRFFRTLYPEGLDRTLIFMNGCSTTGHPDRPTPPMADQLLGEESMYVGWGGITNRWYEVPPEFYVQLVLGWSGEEAVRTLPMYLDQIGEEPGDPVYAEDPHIEDDDCDDLQMSSRDLADIIDLSPEEIEEQGGVEGWCRKEAERRADQHPEQQRRAGKVLATRGSAMRIREVVKLFHPPDASLGSVGDPWVPLDDGDDLGRLIVGGAGALDDGEDDQLRVTVAVEALKLDEPPSTFVQLELDGEPIGERWSFEGARQVDYRPHGSDWAYRLDLEGPRVVEVDQDLEPDEEYELEAVVELPEGGESRYAARLVTHGTYWRLAVSGGPAAGVYGASDVRISIRDGRIVSIGLHDPDNSACPMISIRPRTPISGTGGVEAEAEVAFVQCEGSFGSIAAGTAYQVTNAGEEREVVDPSHRPGLHERPRLIELPSPAELVIREMSDEWIVGSLRGEFFESAHGDERNRYDVRVNASVEFRLHRGGAGGS